VRLLVRVMVLVIAILAALSMLRGALSPSAPGRAPATGRRKERTGKLLKDPVCGTYVTAEGAPTARRDSEVFYFCSDACRQQFLVGSSQES